ncbi:MAG TPA: hypothetical protein VGM10_12510 [Actinocrinis sp.]|jgi:hypothetical protein
MTDENSAGRGIRVTRLYADAEGVSHFADVELATEPAAFAPPAPPVDVTEPRPASRTLFLRMPAGWFGEPHPVPAEQLMILLAGRAEVRTGDGETRVFGAGDAVLAQDTTGAGHVTRALGEPGEEVVIAVTQY